MDDWRSKRIEAALAGANPMVMARMDAGFAVIGDTQFLPGYSVLLTDDPGVQRLSDLPRSRRLAYLADLDRLAEAVEQACAQADPNFRRVNIEILGNTDPYLHAHVFPRYSWEDDELVTRPVWLYPASRWSDPAYAFGPDQEQLRHAITDELSPQPTAVMVPRGEDGSAIAIAPYLRSHAPGVAALCAGQGWIAYADPDRAATGLAAPGSTVVVALDGTEVVGFCQVLGDGQAHGFLAQMAIRPSHRRQGIAWALVEAAKSAADVRRLDLLGEDGSQDFWDTFAHRTFPGYRLYTGLNPALVD